MLHKTVRSPVIFRTLSSASKFNQLALSSGARSELSPVINCVQVSGGGGGLSPRINYQLRVARLHSLSKSCAEGSQAQVVSSHFTHCKKRYTSSTCGFSETKGVAEYHCATTIVTSDVSVGKWGPFTRLEGLLTVGTVVASARNYRTTSANGLISRSYFTRATCLPRPTIFAAFPKTGVQTVSFKRMGQSNCTPDTNQNAAASSSSASGGGKDSSTDPIEAVVCSTEGFNDGDKREVEVGETKVLLVKDKGQFYAVGNKCTHYGAPLSKGSFCNGVVRCPWHGARFNVRTGDIEDFPGLDSLHTFQVEVRGTDVVVKANPNSVANFRRVKPMVKKIANDQKSVVIVGGGPASVVCAETLRQEGFTGKITLVSKENSLPYDRIKLSKALSVKADEIALRKAEFYSDNGIDLMLGQEVTKVDPSSSHLVLSGGETIPYTSLVIATGGQPRRPNIPGSDLANVFVLRTVEDANAIAEQAKDKNVVVLGSSFIGLEVAGFMVGKAASVKVIGTSKVPLTHVFGEDIGAWFKKLHEDKGVGFHSGTTITEFVGADGRLTSVKLGDGTTLDADVCVMGVGVTPATDFLKDSGLSLTDRGYVTVDKNMRTNLKNVYAAGDITNFPLSCMGNNSINIQHWQMAHQHGRTAGLDIAGKSRAINSVPYFWTVQYGKSVRYAGYNHSYDDMVLHGDLAENKFVAFYIKNSTVVAAASCGWDPVVSQFADLLARGDTLPQDIARSEPSSWMGKLGSPQ